MRATTTIVTVRAADLDVGDYVILQGPTVEGHEAPRRGYRVLARLTVETARRSMPRHDELSNREAFDYSLSEAPDDRIVLVHAGYRAGEVRVVGSVFAPDRLIETHLTTPTRKDSP